MTVLALKLSRYANGVSSLHGTVSRRMWQPLFGNIPEENVPIGHITNGVHVQSWVAPQMHLLFDRHMGTDWPKRQRHPETWEGIDTVADAELWETQQVQKARLINFVRNPPGGSGPAPGRARRRHRPGHAGARFERAHHRFRPAVRHLQALGPDLARHRALGRADKLHRPPDPDHLRRQGPPRRPDGQGADPEYRPVHQARAVRSPHRVRRRLRHRRRAATGSGGRRLAQQSAPASRGQRHVG